MVGSPGSETNILPSFSRLKPVQIDLFLGSGGFSVAHTVGGLRRMHEDNYLRYIREIKASSAGSAAAIALLTGRFDQAMDVLFALADGHKRAQDAAARGVVEKSPLQDVSCLSDVFDRFVTDDDLRLISSKEVPPLKVRAYNLDSRVAEYLPVSVYGRQALVATSAFCGEKEIDGRRYTDTALRAPMDVQSSYPRIIFHLRSHGSLRNKWDSMNFLYHTFGLSGFLGYVAKDWREGRVLQGLEDNQILSRKRGTWSPTLILGPHIDVSFTTTDKDVLKRAEEQGYNDALQIRPFISQLEERTYGCQSGGGKVFAAGPKPSRVA